MISVKIIKQKGRILVNKFEI